MKLDFTFQKIYHNSAAIITNSLCTVSRWTFIARIVDELAKRYPISCFTQMGLYSIGILGLWKMAKDRPTATALTILGLRLIFDRGKIHYTETQFKELFYEGYQFPKSIKVPPIQSLNVVVSRGFQGIPEGVEVVKLKITCIGSSRLPKGLKAKSISIYFRGSFPEIPEGIEIEKLTIENCNNFISLPKGLKAKTIIIQSCQGFREIPEGVEIEKLTIENCNNFTSLPKGLKAKSIFINHSHSFQETPEDMECDELNIAFCRNFANLRHYLKTKILKIRDCDSFQEIPEGMECDMLDIFRCENFANPSANLKVKHLHIMGCTALQSVPAGWRIEQSISISECSVLQEIGAPSFLGGHIDLRGCPNINRLPSWIRDLPQLPLGMIRQVHLTGTGITEDQIQALGRVPGIHYFISQQAAQVDVESSSLAQLISYWRKEAGYDGKEFTIELRPDQLDAVLKYGAGLRNTSDYKDENIRAFLAKRIVSVFLKMSENNDIKEAALFHINQGLISCDDRIIDALDDIEQMILLHDAPTMDKIALRELGKGFFFLRMVQKKAQEHVAAILGKKGYVDELEVHLRFKIGLKARFNLPIQTHGMIFRKMAFITDEELQAIGDKIAKEDTEEALETFFAAWSPWRQFSIPSYEDLEEAQDYRMDPNVLCIISQQSPENPVLCHGNIYDYDFLKNWFLTSDQDPATRQPIVWKDIKRVLLSTTHPTTIKDLV